MFQVNVTIGFNAETLAAINSLFAASQKPVKAPVAERPSVSKGTAAKVETLKETPVVNGNHAEDEDEEGVATKVVTAEKVRAAVVATKQKLNTDIGIKGILAEFGAVDAQGKTKLTELKAKDYPEFLTRLEVLK